MQANQNSVSKFATEIINNFENIKPRIFISKIIPFLQQLLQGGDESERSIASIIILFISQKSKKNFKILKSEGLVKEVGELAVIGLNEIGLVKRTKNLKTCLESFTNINCTNQEKFFFKYGYLGQNQSDIISITEINFYLKGGNLNFFPDPKKFIFWARKGSDEDTLCSKNKRSEGKNRFLIKKRSVSLQRKSRFAATPRFGELEKKRHFSLKKKIEISKKKSGFRIKTKPVFKHKNSSALSFGQQECGKFGLLQENNEVGLKKKKGFFKKLGSKKSKKRKRVKRPRVEKKMIKINSF